MPPLTRSHRFTLRLALVAAFLICSHVSASAADFVEGRVVGVTDGDTITVLTRDERQHRVRLLGIDAPEGGQAYGQRSKQHLSDLVFGKQVGVWVPKLDRYGRALGKVQAGGRDVNLEQIRAGMAWYYRHYERDVFKDDRKVYDRAEAEARAARRGLWADANPTPPWDFRRGGRPPASPRETAGGSWEEAGAESEPVAETVYVTRTGAKYHRQSCQYLRRSRIPVALKDAKKYYTACSVCRPPE